MAKGAESKKVVFEKVMEIFKGSFLYNDGKELRINLIENGEVVQIKMALTCAKTPVSNGEDVVLPGEKIAETEVPSSTEPMTAAEPLEPTETEKANLKNLMETLGL